MGFDFVKKLMNRDRNYFIKEVIYETQKTISYFVVNCCWNDS